jgi:crotonobetainyl-CoA:carnitine CoA-transferase CaiB-like acyl-CoA transferase
VTLSENTNSAPATSAEDDGAIASGLPLSHLRIVDLSQAIFGAGTTQMLADLGAQVIKIEPPWGEMMRRPRTRYRTLRGQNLNVDDPDTAPWLAMNRNKKSIAVNLKDKRGLEICRKLIVDSDILIHNFRLGRMNELGLDYESVVAMNDNIVYVELSAFGPSGPMSRWAGGDMWAQALGGGVSVNGDPRSGPSLIPLPVADQSGAIIAAFAIMAALVMREKTGRSQYVQTSLLDAMLHMQSAQLADYLVDGVELGRSGRGWRGAFPFGAYSAADGDVVIIHGEDPGDWQKLCRLLGLEDFFADERYSTAEQRREQRFDLYPVLDAAFKAKTRAEWQAAFHAVGLRCDPCLRYDELVDSPQVTANDHVISVSHARRGPMRFVAPPFRLNGRRAVGANAAPPGIGDDTVEIVESLGYDGPAVEALLSEGVIWSASRPYESKIG